MLANVGARFGETMVFRAAEDLLLKLHLLAQLLGPLTTWVNTSRLLHHHQV